MRGFTLSEILMTLGILGVVAAMTIPTFFTKNTTNEHSARIKKAYASVSMAFEDAWQSRGIGGMSKISINEMAKAIPRTLKVRNKSGFGYTMYKPNQQIFDPGSFNVGVYTMYDGTIFGVNRADNYCEAPNTAGFEAVIDSNGAKGPNIVGKDIFVFFSCGSNAALKAHYQADASKCSSTTYSKSSDCSARLIQNGLDVDW